MRDLGGHIRMLPTIHSDMEESSNPWRAKEVRHEKNI